MIKVYGLESCPDCKDAKEQIKDKKDEFIYFDIATNTALMKEFLQIRDNNPIFDKIKQDGKIGIPCFVKEDGTVTLDPKDVGLKESGNVIACSFEDHLNGKKGC